MSAGDDFPTESAEDLYENAPCGYLSSRADGTIVKVNRTFEAWTGLSRDDLLGATRFQDLLSPGGRIYYETHCAPLLQMQGSVSEIAVEIVRSDGSRLPALINSVLVSDPGGSPQGMRTTIFDASDRRRYERELLTARKEEREIALELQRGLLSKDLPAIEGIELESAYRAGRAGTEIGGDWYDAFCSDSTGDRLWLVVGDVVGRGIEAAAQMGQLRSAVRALADTGAGPAGLLEALDRYSNRHGVGRMATLLCAELERDTGRLRYACAGHLPPVVAPAEGPAEFLWEGRSLPLAVSAPAPRAEGERLLAPGSTLLLYTDGLIERRERGIDESMELLLTVVGDLSDLEPRALVGGLIRRLHEPGDADDVCLVAARVDNPALPGIGSRQPDKEGAMSNVDTLKQGYEAFGRGDLDGATESFSDDIRWENPEAPQLPNSGVTEGKDSVKALFADLFNHWSSFTLTPDEFIDGGDTVVVLSHAEATAKETGKDVKLPFVHIWRYRDGKAVEVQALTDTAMSADALGTL